MQHFEVSNALLAERLGRWTAKTPVPGPDMNMVSVHPYPLHARHCLTMSLGPPRVFATSRRCDASGVLLASSRLRDFTTLRRRCWGLLASVRLCDAATLRGASRVFASSRLRNEILEPAQRAQWKKCASRHNGVHFFDIWTSKSGPSMWCF